LLQEEHTEGDSTGVPFTSRELVELVKDVPKFIDKADTLDIVRQIN
jgi:hypothetical protein